MGIIYKITSPSGKGYVGQTEGTLEHRMKVHMAPGSKCPAIKSAIDKYGFEAMQVEVLMRVPNNELSKWEVAMIKEHNTYGPRGYNLTPGGDLPPLKCPEVAQRLRVTMATPEVKAKLSAAQRRNHAMPGSKAKRSAAIKAAHAKPDVSERYHKGWKKAQNREDVKEKQRVAQRKAHKNPAIHNARMAGLEATRKDPKKEAARIKAIRDANARDPGINKRRSETLKATLAKKKAMRTSARAQPLPRLVLDRNTQLPVRMYDPSSPSATNTSETCWC